MAGPRTPPPGTVPANNIRSASHWTVTGGPGIWPVDFLCGSATLPVAAPLFKVGQMAMGPCDPGSTLKRCAGPWVVCGGGGAMLMSVALRILFASTVCGSRFSKLPRGLVKRKQRECAMIAMVFMIPMMCTGRLVMMSRTGGALRRRGGADAAPDDH